MITVFTRVETDDIDSLINDPEVVLALVEDLGFDPSDLLSLAGQAENIENVDPMALLQSMEERWNGEGQTFSLEDQIYLLTHILQQTEIHKGSRIANLHRAGKAAPVYTEHGPVRVITPEEAKEIAQELELLPVENIQGYAKLERLNAAGVLPHENWTEQELITAPLWQLYDALGLFFKNASEGDQYILLAVTD